MQTLTIFSHHATNLRCACTLCYINRNCQVGTGLFDKGPTRRNYGGAMSDKPTETHAESVRAPPAAASRACRVRRLPDNDQLLSSQAPSLHSGRERVLFIGTQFSILYTSMYSPTGAASPCACVVSCKYAHRRS